MPHTSQIETTSNSSHKSDRIPLLAFAAEAASEAALRETLATALPQGIVVKRGNVRAAVAYLQKNPTPLWLIVDVGGESQPLLALGQLAEFVEPDVGVLVFGDVDNLDFYRQATKVLGILEYLPKPLAADTIARYFKPLLTHAPRNEEMIRGGKLITVTGARGGVGATSIAAYLAWHFGVDAMRHTVLLDPDLHTGSSTILLDTKPSSGLRAALEAPHRIDDLFVGRVTQPVSGRLELLAAEESLIEDPRPAPDAAPRLIDALRQRYNFILADVPFASVALNRDLLNLANQRIVVTLPTLAGVRDVLRLMALPQGPSQVHRPTLVLNRATMPGALPRQQIEDALRLKIDILIPDLPRQFAAADHIGRPQIAVRGGFRSAIVKLADEITHINVSLARPERAPQRRSAMDWFRRVARP